VAVANVSVADAIAHLRGLKGVAEAFELGPEIKELLRKIEGGIKATMDIEVKNTGLEECLKRRHVLCIIKDRTFRPPPEPTIYLAADKDTILGQEILEKDKCNFEGLDNLVYLSEDFVVFTDRKAESKEYFLMPSVSFPELENLCGLKSVVSCSPSALGDLAIRTAHGLEDNPKLASVLIGFDLEGG